MPAPLPPERTRADWWSSSRREQTRARRSRLDAQARGGGRAWWFPDGRTSSRDPRAPRLRDRESVPAAASPAVLTSQGRCEASPSVPPESRSASIYPDVGGRASAACAAAPVRPAGRRFRRDAHAIEATDLRFQPDTTERAARLDRAQHETAAVFGKLGCDHRRVVAYDSRTRQGFDGRRLPDR